MTSEDRADARSAGGPRRLPQPFPTPPSRIGELGRLTDLFWDGTSSLVSVTSERTPPPASRTIESYAIVPSARRPRYLLPLLSRSVASRAVGLYGPLRPTLRRASRFVASVGLRVGIAQACLRDRLYVHVSDRVPDTDLGQVSLVYHLAQTCGSEVAAGMIALGGGGPYAKPVIQVLSSRGDPLGFVKVGWDAITRRLVANEARMLEICARRSPRTFRIPELLTAGRWNELELSVVSPLPKNAQRYATDAIPSLEITEEICGLTDSSVRLVWTSAYAAALQRRIGGPTPPRSESEPLGADLLAWLRDRFPDASMPIGAWHGDWVPWNLAVSGRDVYAWDWEHSGDSVPLGLDVIHFYFQTAAIRDDVGFEEALRRSRAASSEPLRRLGIPDRLHGLLMILYLLEVRFRAEEVAQLGGIPNRRLYPAVLEALRHPSDLT